MTSDGTRTFSYDIENRLVGATGGTSGITTYLYDGDALVGEYDGAGAMTRRYIHGDGADVPLISYAGAGLTLPSYLHANHQGSIVALSNASGAVTAVNRYDEYGIPGVGNAGRFQYTGQIWLAELGMYYYKARIYSPTLGRFMQTDPVGYQDQFNLYAYVGNDPVNRIDPTGMTCEEVGTQRNGQPRYSCSLNDAGPLNIDEQKQATRAYTDSVNTLMGDPTHQETITVAGISITVTARDIAEGLIRSDVHGGDEPGAGGHTVGGELHPEGATSDGRPVITINRVGLQQQEVGDGKFAERERARVFVHEGTHTVRQERAFVGIRDFNDVHQGPYRRSTNGFYGQ